MYSQVFRQEKFDTEITKNKITIQYSVTTKQYPPKLLDSHVFHQANITTEITIKVSKLIIQYSKTTNTFTSN